MSIQDSWLIQEFRLCNNLLQQAIGALNKDRLKRAEKLIQEAAKVAERLKQWKSDLPSDQCSCEIADAIERLHKTIMERHDWFLKFGKNGLSRQNS